MTPNDTSSDSAGEADNARAHRNHQLFSDHYLDRVLPGRPDWVALSSEAADFYAWLRSHFHERRELLPRLKEAQLESQFIRPVLQRLGHTFEVQPSLETPDGTQAPDYVLFGDQNGCDATAGVVLNESQLARTGGLAVGDAKAWRRPLDRAVTEPGTDPHLFSNRNPSYQIAFYIQHSGLQWGILTNGQFWRLYHRESAHKLDRYYEIDLQALISREDMHGFLYFYGFFRRGAFDTANPVGLDSILQESVDYAQGIGASIKKQVFDALRHLAQGFLDLPTNRLGATPSTLEGIYSSSLIVLYRLLFVLYAEARGLLPMRESGEYAGTYSLSAIVRGVATRIDSGHRGQSSTTQTWSRLDDLFRMIDGGHPPLRVATFNGGLFDPAKQPFLRDHRIGDAHLEAALDLIARVPIAGARQLVDYRDLATRHLGTIYEGLLEYHLAALEVAEPDGIGGLFTVALLNERGERKASGSYYTPDFVVAHIVSEVLGPTVSRLVASHSTDEARREAILSVNVLDPAMGSGHFLVEAVEYLARFLTKYDVESPGGVEDSGASVTEWKRRVAQSCIYGVDRNELAVELAKLSLWLSTAAKDRPLSYLDHHLRCGDSLVGSNLTALRTLQAQFAPKRRRRGQASKQQVSLLDDDAFRASLRDAISSMATIEQNPARTVADVKEQERLYVELRTRLVQRYGKALHVVTALHLGLEIPESLEGMFLDHALGYSTAQPQLFPKLLVETERSAHEGRYFHWELEFPDVFFSPSGESLGPTGGFNAVVGNPPYIRESGNKEKFAYVQAAEPYKAWYRGKTDLYFYFIMRAVWLLRDQGLLGFITPAQWLEAVSSKKLQKFLSTEAWPLAVTVFDGRRVFEDASVEPLVLLAQRMVPRPTSNKASRVSTGSQGGQTEAEHPPTAYRYPREGQTSAAEVLRDGADVSVPTELITSPRGWYFKALRTSGATALTTRVESVSRKLGDLFHIEAGVNTGADQITPRMRKYWPKDARQGEGIFVLSAQEVTLLSLPRAEAAYLKPIVMPEGVGRYVQTKDDGRRLIYLTREAPIGELPHIEAHLKRFQTLLESRAEIKRNEEREWWHLLWPRDSKRFNVPEKLVIPNATARNAFYLDAEQTYYNIGCTVLSPLSNAVDVAYVLALLNSRLYDYYYGLRGQAQSAGQRKYFPEKVRTLPIRASTAVLTAGDQARIQEIVAKWTRGEGKQNLRGLKGRQREFALGLLARSMQQNIGAMAVQADQFRLQLEGLLSSAKLRRLSRLWTPRPAGRSRAARPKTRRENTASEQLVDLLGPLAAEQLELSDFYRLSEDQWKEIVKQRLGRSSQFALVVAAWREAIGRSQLIAKAIAETDGLIDDLVFEHYGLTPAEQGLVRKWRP